MKLLPIPVHGKSPDSVYGFLSHHPFHLTLFCNAGRISFVFFNFLPAHPIIIPSSHLYVNIAIIVPKKIQ